MQVKFKKLNSMAVTPTYAKPGDAGMDLTATDYYFDGDKIIYHSGIAVEIPIGFVGLVFPRSSINKYDLELTNSVGVIDSGYRGEIKAVFRFTKPRDEAKYYKCGERFAQLVIMPFPHVSFNEVEELSDSERGRGGYGSTGK